MASYDVAFLNQQISHNARQDVATVSALQIEDKTQQHKKITHQTVAIVQPEERESIGCGDPTPQTSLICITPEAPVSIFEHPGCFVLPEEQRELLQGSGGCKGIQIIEITKEDLFHTLTAEEAQKRWSESELMRELEKRCKELEVTVDNTRPGSWELNPKLGIKDFEWTEKLWDSLRKNDNDIKIIASNIGVSEGVIAEIKEHLFYRIHKKRYETAPFDPDYDMSKAWVRLIEGKFFQADLALLKHELAEALLMHNQGLDYDAAHDIVEEFFSWRDQL